MTLFCFGDSIAIAQFMHAVCTSRSNIILFFCFCAVFSLVLVIAASNNSIF